MGKFRTSKRMLLKKSGREVRETMKNMKKNEDLGLILKNLLTIQQKNHAKVPEGEKEKKAILEKGMLFSRRETTQNHIPLRPKIATTPNKTTEAPKTWLQAVAANQPTSSSMPQQARPKIPTLTPTQGKQGKGKKGKGKSSKSEEKGKKKGYKGSDYRTTKGKGKYSSDWSDHSQWRPSDWDEQGGY